jgi:hypothetical protein
MQLQQSIRNVFVQLRESIEQLSDLQYTKPIAVLSNATIGQHVRHIVELFVCLENGYITGLVNYENRKRDKRFETDRALTSELLSLISRKLDKVNKGLFLQLSKNEPGGNNATIETNYYREIVFNLEHTVHHMALIRVGLNEIGHFELPEGFGVAASTIKHRKTTINQ